MDGKRRKDAESDDLVRNLNFLEEIAGRLLREGKDFDAMHFSEQALQLRRDVYGDEDEGTQKAAESLILMVNALSVQKLRQDDFKTCFELLRKAEKLTDEGSILSQAYSTRLRCRSITFNNFGCFYREIGKLHGAMAYLEQTIHMDQECMMMMEREHNDEIEQRRERDSMEGVGGDEEHSVEDREVEDGLDERKSGYELLVESGHNPASSHLNLCVVLSQLSRHRIAVEHACEALFMLLDVDYEALDGTATTGATATTVQRGAEDVMGTGLETGEVADATISPRSLKKERGKGGPDASWKSKVESILVAYKEKHAHGLGGDRGLVYAAFYNLGVEVEYLKDKGLASALYRIGLDEARESLGAAHPTTRHMLEHWSAISSQVSRGYRERARQKEAKRLKKEKAALRRKKNKSGTRHVDAALLCAYGSPPRGLRRKQVSK
eukprot:TRINITY_DN30419_c0_g1_i1.p1 TRINITY_DN30419_c0_g1~~TRINITY_DN30419_c0_g1_i1.p1  ORF type:complete len:468 (-),score=133.24 TRINITY_DN30419_c0_g1_i1:61-1374(-)